MALYVVGLLAANYLIEVQGVSGVLAWVLVLVPGLAVVGLIWAVGMYMAEQEDEFLRMLMVRQQLIATGFVLSAGSVWGLLEEFALVGHVTAIFVVVVWAVGLLVGVLVTRITHGTWGGCV